MALFGSAIAGSLLAIVALVRNERWRWLGVAGLLLNTLPSAGLLIAIVVHWQSS